MTADILSSIHNRLPSFSKGQRRIANYIIEEYDKAAFMTASILGKTAQVSESTVVRFAMALGYEGYPEMQEALQEMVLNRLTAVQRMEVSEIRIAERDVLSTVLQGDAERIRATLDSLNREAFDGAIDAMLSARRVYLLGMRSSSALAVFFGYYLRYILDDVRLLSSGGETFDELVQISPEDAFLAISYPRYSAMTVRALEHCHASGVRTIALTDSSASPLAENADYLLCARSDMVSVVDSLTAPMSLINALLVTLAGKRKGQTAATFNKLEEIWDTYHVYEKNDE